MTDKKMTVMLARMAYGGSESSKLVNWLLSASAYLGANPAIGEVYHTAVEHTAPVARARNKAASAALHYGVDVLVMVDHDIVPHPNFLPAAMKLLLANHAQGYGASIVAAPAICDDGKSNILHWTTPQMPGNFQYSGPLSLERMGAAEASYLSGVGEAAAAGTGAIAIDTRLFRRLPKPWFAVEYADEDEVEIATGEDVYFTRTATEQGARLNVLWDCWCGHEKTVTLAKPVAIHPASIPGRYREALSRTS